MKLNRMQIQQRTRELLDQHPDGLRWNEVLKAIADANPDTQFYSIEGATHALFSIADDIEKVARGTYQPDRHAEVDAGEATALKSRTDAVPFVAASTSSVIK